MSLTRVKDDSISCLHHCYTFLLLVMRPFFAYRAKKPLHTGVRTGCHCLISLSVCLFVCNIRVFNEARPRDRSDRGRFLL